MPGIVHLSGVGYLLANAQHTYLGEIHYTLTLLEEGNDTITLAGQFQFTAESRDITDNPNLVIQLEDSFYISIAVQQHDQPHNRYTFCGQAPRNYSNLTDLYIR